MSAVRVAPAPSASRGEVVLQPTYFTSSIFVNALRDDISALTSAFYQQYSTSSSPHPFSIFRHLWSSQGWLWLHFMVFDDRTRQAFLNTVLRLFLEYTLGTAAPHNRAAALFGFYTFFYTQPYDTAPCLYAVAHVPVPLDHYLSLRALPASFDSATLLPLKSPVSHIVSVLLKEQVFLVVPHSNLSPLNPRRLPREIFIDPRDPQPTLLNVPKKKGRPTKRDKARKAKTALEALNSWLDGTVDATTTNLSLPPEYNPNARTHPSTSSLVQYQTEKSFLLNSIRAEIQSGSSETHLAVERANHFVLERLKTAGQFDTSRGLPLPKEGEEMTGVERVERAFEELTQQTKEWRGGALDLLEGAGMAKTTSSSCRLG